MVACRTSNGIGRGLQGQQRVFILDGAEASAVRSSHGSIHGPKSSRSPLEDAVFALRAASERRHDATPGSRGHQEATAEEERLARLVWRLARSEDGQPA